MVGLGPQARGFRLVGRVADGSPEETPGAGRATPHQPEVYSGVPGEVLAFFYGPRLGGVVVPNNFG
jgi:hypothetical protein